MKSFWFSTLHHLVIATAVSVLWLAGLAGCGSPVEQPETPTAVSILAPTDTPIYLPDLVILDASLESGAEGEDPCATPASPLRLRVTLANQGNAASGAFDLQVDQIRRRVTDGLAAGQSTAMSFVIDNLSPQVRVDVAEQVFEQDEGNNQVALQLSIPDLPTECRQTPTPALTYQNPATTLEGHTGTVHSVSFSPDGNLVVSGSVDNTMRLWLVREGRLLRTMHGHSFPVLKASFTPNGASLITGSTDGLIRIWQVSNGLLARTISGHAGWITGLDISGDGKLLASSAQDFTVRLWRLPDGGPVQTIDEGMAAVSGVIFSPDGKKMAWAEEDGTVRLRALSGEWLHIFKDSEAAAKCVAFSPQGDLLAAGYADGAIHLWRVADGELLQALKGHTQAVNDLSFSPNGSWLASGSADRTLRLWQFAETGLLPLPSVIYTGHSDAINSLDFSPNGLQIVTGSDDGTVRLWNIPQTDLP
jgi:WD40 repeat protein